MRTDYIIVGSGAAGSVLADRLSAGGRFTVLVLEAGGADRSILHQIPKGFYFTMNNQKYAKILETERFGHGGHDTWHRGRVVGGSTTINGMVWNRGGPPDFQAWQQAGNPGWNWSRFLRAFQAIEDHELGVGEGRGVGGPVHISIARPPDPESDAFIETLGRLGVRPVADLNGHDDDRVGYVPSNIAHGRRVSAATAFLRPALRRSNVYLRTDSTVSRVILRGARAVGVQATENGQVVEHFAEREVLLAGGSLETPLLLERSGIGPADVLQSAGVVPLVDSPRVGENLREHRGILLQMRLRGKSGYNAQLSTRRRQAITGLRYLARRDGVMSFGGYNLAAIYRSDPDSARPDTQTFFTPISTAGAHPTTGRLTVDTSPGAMLLTYPLYPTSAGSIHITGPKTADPVRISPNFLSTDHDRRLLVAGFRRAREILATSPFSGHVVSELSPGGDVTDDAAIVTYGIDHGASGYHTLGTCAIGPEAEDVVDDQLRVRGTEALRVADASVFPSMPAGNNNAPTMALAWTAAEMILAA